MSNNQTNHDPAEAWPSKAWDDPRVTAYVMGELSGEDRSAFEQRLQTEPDLQVAVDEASAMTDQLQTLFAGETLAGLDDDRKDRILAAGASNGQSAQAQPATPLNRNASFSRRLVWSLLAAAAGLLIVLGLAPHWQRMEVAQQFNQRLDSAAEIQEVNAIEDLSTAANESASDGEKGIPDTQTESLQRQVASLQERNAKKQHELESKKMSVARRIPQAKAKGMSMPSGEAQPATGPAFAQASPVAAAAAAPGQSMKVPAVRQPKNSRRKSIDATGMGMDEMGMGMGGMMRGDKGEGANIAFDLEPSAEIAGGMMGMDDMMGMEGMDGMMGMEGMMGMGEMTGGMGGMGMGMSNDAAADGVQAAPFPSSPKTESYGVRPPILQGQQQGEGQTYTVPHDETKPLGDTKPGNWATSVNRDWLEELDDLDMPEEARRAMLRQARGLQTRQQPNRDRFEAIVENDFKAVADHPLSTFSIDVDTASYSKVRRNLVTGSLPSPDAVRIEEMLNYFDYDYAPPTADSEHPFATNVTIAGCPWNPDHQLARVAIQGKTMDAESRPPCNLVFLLDTSGSMNSPNKLPLVIQGMKKLTKQLTAKDRVAIVVYAGSAGLVMESTPADKQKKIKRALTSLSAGGSTNGGAGIKLAYATARDHFIDGGANRVILCTDGDFNVGLSGTDQLVELVKDEASSGIFLTALGFGMGNHNDAMMEQISGKGNGNYAFIDTEGEAKKVLVRQTEGTLVTIAKDVKIQIEFNPRLVQSYRLIGYENRVMAKEDFADDKKDAGEIGAGHQVTALYEIVSATRDSATRDSTTVVDVSNKDVSNEDADAESSDVPALRYQKPADLSQAAASDEVMTVQLRYKQPQGTTSKLITLRARQSDLSFADSDTDFRFAAAVASFGMQLRHSKYAGAWSIAETKRVASESLGDDPFGMRAELIQLIDKSARFLDAVPRE